LYVNQRGTVFEICNELNGHNSSLANYDNGRIKDTRILLLGAGRCADEDALSNNAREVAFGEIGRRTPTLGGVDRHDAGSLAWGSLRVPAHLRDRSMRTDIGFA
jgi:hypothetical protein